jgi:hypothetical protein
LFAKSVRLRKVRSDFAKCDEVQAHFTCKVHKLTIAKT